MDTDVRTGSMTHVFSVRFQEIFSGVLRSAAGEGVGGRMLLERAIDDEFAGLPELREFVVQNLHHVAVLLERGYREICLRPALGGLELIGWR